MQYILNIKDLHVHFQTFEGIAKVINGVNLAVGEKEIVALIGESGSGKSLTVYTVLGVLLPNARVVRGRVFFKGRDLLVMDEEERHLWTGNKISFIPQHPMISLHPAFKVGEQMSDLIRWTGKVKGSLSGYFSRASARSRNEDREARRKALKIFEQIDLPSPAHVMESYPFELSGGMRQRVLIAMAVVVDPVLMIADEPGSAVDVTIEDKINRLLMALTKEKGLSLLYITHNLGIAKMISQRIYVMYAGCIVEAGRVETIFKSPMHPYTVGLIDAIPKVSGEGVKGIDGRKPSYINPPKGCRFHPRCRHAMNICKEKIPELKSGNGHLVACHLYD